MGWAERIISEAELAPYFEQAETHDLRAQALALLAQQKATWPQLQTAVQALAKAKQERFIVKGSHVLAQFNPQRLVSTGAKVDAASIKARPCFLCPDNLPPEERGLAFGDDFVVLCNPYPVFHNHLVIAARRHTPQELAGNLGALLDLTQQLGGDFFTLYNGPRCGASAPDHLHFQACSNFLEMFFSYINWEVWQEPRLYTDAAIEAFAVRNYRIKVLAVRSQDRASLLDWIQGAIATLAVVTNTTAEPLLNIIAMFAEGCWKLLLFPRSRHRPSHYDAEEPNRLTVSPAALDLAGLLVVPQAEHFARINAELIEQIYAEVTLDDDRFAKWVWRIQS